MNKEMPQDTSYDLVIIGGGPGGYTAAIRAAQLGARVAVVEKEDMGGTCLNRGCIPTKVMVRTAQMMEDARETGAEYGIQLNDPELDLATTVDKKDDIVQQLKSGVQRLVTGNGADIYEGEAEVIGAHEVLVHLHSGDEVTLQPDKLLLAVGSVPGTPPIDGIDLPGVITSRELLDLRELPDRLIIVGGNVIGLEFASIFGAFGTEVTVLGRNPKLLKYMDDEISRRIRPQFRRRGLNVVTDAPVLGIEEGDGGEKVVRYEQRGEEQQTAAELVLIATGRTPNIDQLPLEAMGVEVADGAIAVDEYMVTSNPDVLAIGDAIGGMMLAHVAAAEALVAVENLFGSGREPLNRQAIPDVAFTLPPAASVGLHEEEAAEQYPEMEVAKFSFRALGKAVAIGKAHGQVKIVYDGETRRVLGMHIIGPEAPVLIHEGALAIQNGLTVEQLGETVHGHPTLSEAVMEAAHVAMGAPIHMMPR